jgi:hypothetical protein
MMRKNNMMYSIVATLPTNSDFSDKIKSNGVATWILPNQPKTLAAGEKKKMATYNFFTDASY